jgi:hypothetical protein
LLQIPPQQSAFAAQESPFCTQNEPVAQRPSRQSFEQHWPCAVHAFPVVRHVGFSREHTAAKAPHSPLQHSDDL